MAIAYLLLFQLLKELLRRRTTMGGTSSGDKVAVLIAVYFDPF